MDHVAVRVGEHLDLDVPWVLEVALDVDRRVGEIRLPFAPRGLERLRGLLRRANDLHPLAAAAGRRLDQQRVADLGRRARTTSSAESTGSVVPGMIGTPAACIACARAGLRAHQLDRGGRRADPDEPGRLDGAREAGVLGQEPVAGMHRLGPRAARRPRAACRRRGSSRPRSGRRGQMPRRRRRRAGPSDRRPSRRRPRQYRAREASGRCAGRSLHGWRRGLWRTHSVFSRSDELRRSIDRCPRGRRADRGPLFAVSFNGHDYWATGVFCAAMATDWFDGRVARRSGRPRRSARCSIRSPTSCS